MRDATEIYSSLTKAGKGWFAVFIAAFTLSIVMNLTIVSWIGRGHGLPFDTGKRIYTHQLKSRHGARTLQVTGAENIVLTVFQVMPWIAIASLGGLLICVMIQDDPKNRP